MNTQYLLVHAIRVGCVVPEAVNARRMFSVRIYSGMNFSLGISSSVKQGDVSDTAVSYHASGTGPREARY
jgi:hypothetical protein